MKDYQDDIEDMDDEEVESMDPTENEALQAAVAAEIKDAVDYIDEELSEDRAKATRYYKGEPFGTEEDGRNDHISTDVRDTVLGMMPSLMRIFTGSEYVVEFAPVGPEDVANAEQATDAIHHIFMKENCGFHILYQAFKDALVRKTGVVKWWYEERKEAVTYNYTGLDEMAYLALLNDPSVEVVEVESYPAEGMEAAPVNPQTGLPGFQLYDLSIRRNKVHKKYCVAAVPPEEFLFSRRQVNLDDTGGIVAHRCEKTVSDLVAMGYDEELVLEHAGSTGTDIDMNEERYDRNPQLAITKADRNDESSKKVEYVEAYIRYDLDGDGVAELLKVCCIGTGLKIINVEGADEIPFAFFTPDPEPHTLVGLSEAEKVMDIQETKSEITRDILDSLAQAIHPRTGVVEGQVNMDDVLNNETGAVIRMRAPGMVQPFAMPFVGQQAFPMLEYMDMTKEARTGVSKASQGLNADALQSSTRAAVAATISASQGRIELVARVFAEIGLTRLFRGLLRMFIKHQDAPRMMRLRGQFVQVDPRVWNADMDMEINVTSAAVTNEERVGILQGIAEKQELILQSLGPNNPIVSMSQYTYTLSKAVELAGFRDSTQFFNRLPADFKMPEPQQPPVDPETAIADKLAEVEREKAQFKAQMDAQKLQLDREKKEAELALEREKMQMEFAREREKLELQRAKQEAELEMRQAQIILQQLSQLQNNNSQQAQQQQVEGQAQEQQSQLAQAIAVLGQLIAQGQSTTTAVMTAPRRVVRDENGRVAGVEIDGGQQ